MAYTVRIFSPVFPFSPPSGSVAEYSDGYSGGYSAGYPSSDALTFEGAPAVGGSATSAVAAAPAEVPPLRRLKRIAAYGPRCPDCAGPLVFGEGCQLCPVCGYSGCGPRR